MSELREMLSPFENRQELIKAQEDLKQELFDLSKDAIATADYWETRCKLVEKCFFSLHDVCSFDILKTLSSGKASDEALKAVRAYKEFLEERGVR